MSKRVFKKAGDAMTWAKHVMDETNKTYLEDISEQIYKDSEKFTYYDTFAMYKSGALYSQFNKGLIIERSPYVRRRYYEGGRPRKNQNATRKWFNTTTQKYKKQYIKRYGPILEGKKK